MSWLDHLKLSYRKFCAEIIKLDKSEHTPILFEDYNNEDYYYVLNLNYNYIYSLEEMYMIIKDTRDPFTRLPIVNLKIVRIKLNQ